MRRGVILDTGPLVALLDRRDKHHGWTREQWEGIGAPLLTCEAVLAEACHLVRALPRGVEAVLAMARRGVLDLSFRLADDLEAVTTLLDKYHDTPMSLADGCLVRMAEIHSDAVVLTLDAGFLVYRKNGRQRIPVLMPEQ